MRFYFQLRCYDNDQPVYSDGNGGYAREPLQPRQEPIHRFVGNKTVRQDAQKILGERLYWGALEWKE
jgi:hypothetical protein